MIDFLGFKILTKEEYSEARGKPLVLTRVIYRSLDSNYEPFKLPPKVNQLLVEASQKYPPTIIKYAGTTKKGGLAYPIDVRNYALCGQNDEDLLNFVTEKKANVDNFLNDDASNFHEACDKAVAKINQITKVNYAFDINNYGFSEYWQFAPLTFKVNEGDCDDYATLRYALCRIAGVHPQLMRVGVGLVASGGGHCTNYYLSSKLEWLHLNSTTNFGDLDTVEKQTLKDSTLEIKDFWFSFNELDAWSKLESKEAMESFKLQKQFKVSENKGS